MVRDTVFCRVWTDQRPCHEAFVLAVGLITDQLARIFGLAALILELRRCGARAWEAWLVGAFLLASLGLIAATVGVALGEVRCVSIHANCEHLAHGVMGYLQGGTRSSSRNMCAATVRSSVLSSLSDA